MINHIEDHPVENLSINEDRPKEEKGKTSFEKLANHAIQNQTGTVMIGIALILTGIIFLILAHAIKTEFHLNLSEGWLFAIKVLTESFGHLLIIIGEIIAVTFFLHNVIDDRVRHKYELLFQKSILSVHDSTLNQLNGKITNWDDSLNQKTTAIQKNLAEAVLAGLEILPYEMVDKIRKAEYAPNLLREDYTLSYKYVEPKPGAENMDFIEFVQSIRYKIINLGHKTEELPIWFALNTTPQAKYEYLKSKIQFCHNEPEVLTTEMYITDDAGEVRTLKTPIQLKTNEFLTVFHEVNIKFFTKDNTIVSDLFSASQYTLNVKVIVEGLPPIHTVSIYPTGNGKKSKLIPDKWEPDVKQYAEIDFLLPGQGFFLELMRNPTISKELETEITVNLNQDENKN